MSTKEDIQQQVAAFRDDYNALRQRITEVFVGSDELIDAALTALLAGGHLLLEGEPGVGKTMLAQTMTEAIDLADRRIQFTPDLSPADVIGTYVVMESHGRRTFEFQQGPVFTNVLLADEINRATPKTQAALLEAMEEGCVTVANETYDLPEPFRVIATQGTDDASDVFALGATQADRFFFKLTVPPPTADQADEILKRSLSPIRASGAAEALGREYARRCLCLCDRRGRALGVARDRARPASRRGRRASRGVGRRRRAPGGAGCSPAVRLVDARLSGGVRPLSRGLLRARGEGAPQHRGR